MFDFGKLGDLSNLAGEARRMQEKQETAQREHILYLKKITEQLDQVISLLKSKQ